MQCSAQCCHPTLSPSNWKCPYREFCSKFLHKIYITSSIAICKHQLLHTTAHLLLNYLSARGKEWNEVKPLRYEALSSLLPPPILTVLVRDKKYPARSSPSGQTWWWTQSRHYSIVNTWLDGQIKVKSGGQVYILMMMVMVMMSDLKCEMKMRKLLVWSESWSWCSPLGGGREVGTVLAGGYSLDKKSNYKK